MEIEWHDYLSVGVKEIDQQHKLLIERYNAFFTAYNQGQAAEELTRLFNFLVEYVTTHFADEENLQLRVGFPDYQNHWKQHQELSGRVAEFKVRIEDGKYEPSLISSAGLLMTGWLIEHISVMDRAVGRFIKESQSQAVA